jgi:hypothetical protein
MIRYVSAYDYCSCSRGVWLAKGLEMRCNIEILNLHKNIGRSAGRIVGAFVGGFVGREVGGVRWQYPQRVCRLLGRMVLLVVKSLLAPLRLVSWNVSHLLG